MQPRDAIITVHHKRQEFGSWDVDGNTPSYHIIHETELVRGRVWPVAMGADELLVEWEDGWLGAVKLRDIRLLEDMDD